MDDDVRNLLQRTAERLEVATNLDCLYLTMPTVGYEDKKRALGVFADFAKLPDPERPVEDRVWHWYDSTAPAGLGEEQEDEEPSERYRAWSRQRQLEAAALLRECLAAGGGG